MEHPHARRSPVVDDPTARARALQSADRLFYTRGIQAVGMDALSRESGLGLKRLYQLFASKESIVELVLRGRHDMWVSRLERAVAAVETPRDKLLAIYDFLEEWFAEDDFRGCVFINSFGELGSSFPRVAEIVRTHKQDFQRYMSSLARNAGAPESLGAQLAILAEGAQTTAAISRSVETAASARAAAETLIAAALGPRD